MPPAGGHRRAPAAVVRRRLHVRPVDPQHVDPAQVVERVDDLAGRVARHVERAPRHVLLRDPEADLAHVGRVGDVEEARALLVEALGHEPAALVEVVRRAQRLRAAGLDVEAPDVAQLVVVADPPRLERARARAGRAVVVLLGDQHDVGVRGRVGARRRLGERPVLDPHRVVVDVVVEPGAVARRIVGVGRLARRVGVVDEHGVQRVADVVRRGAAVAGDPREPRLVVLDVVGGDVARRLLGREVADDLGLGRVAEVDDVDPRRGAGEVDVVGSGDERRGVAGAAAYLGGQVDEPERVEDRALVEVQRPGAHGADDLGLRRIAHVDHVEPPGALGRVVGDQRVVALDVDVLVLEVRIVERAQLLRRVRIGDVVDRQPAQRREEHQRRGAPLLEARGDRVRLVQRGDVRDVVGLRRRRLGRARDLRKEEKQRSDQKTGANTHTGECKDRPGPMAPVDPEALSPCRGGAGPRGATRASSACGSRSGGCARA